jgi:hypothetical protein
LGLFPEVATPEEGSKLLHEQIQLGFVWQFAK